MTVLVNTHIEHETLGTLRVPTYPDIKHAAATIAPYVVRTPLLRCARLDDLVQGRVWIKAECLQVTGSFKARGAFNALLKLDAQQRQRGVVAYSTGNHGQAIAWAGAQLGIATTIVMPADAPRNKVARALDQGARVVQYDRQRESREEIGMRLLAETGGMLIPPGDHPDVIAGQGTVALEAIEDLPADALQNLHLFAAPCGGGGLLAGCGLVIHEMTPDTQVIAAEPDAFDDTVRSLKSGQRERNAAGAQSLCDALQAVTPAELPYAINRRLLNDAVSVSDRDVIRAMQFALQELRVLVEPGGAVALAALLSGSLRLNGHDAVIVLSGGNVDMPLLGDLLHDPSASR